MGHPVFLTPPQIGLKLSGTRYWTLLKKDNQKEVSIINPNREEEAEFFLMKLQICLKKYLEIQFFGFFGANMTKIYIPNPKLILPNDYQLFKI